MKGSELKNHRKELGLTQDQLAKKVGLDRKTIISYEKMEVIPSGKSTYLYNFFNKNKDSNKLNKSVFFEKEGVKFTLEEATALIARNPERAKEDPLMRQFLANYFLKLVKNSTEDDGVSLRKLLDNIDF